MDKVRTKLLILTIVWTVGFSLLRKNELVAQVSPANMLTTLEIKNNNFDHGRVKADTVLQTNFTIVNTGQYTLKIEDVVISCNCTQYNLTSKEIAPQDSCKFEMQMKTKGKNDRAIFNAMLKTNTFDRFYILESSAIVLPRDLE